MIKKGNTNRIFISYARGDDEPFVRRLYEDLTLEGLIVWFDRESMPQRPLTFIQEIKDVIRTDSERLIYVAGPKAKVSDYVRQEWKFALECDKHVIPILRLGGLETEIPGELSLLHCEDFREDSNYSAMLSRLVDNLHQPDPPLGALLAVPSLPYNFLARPDLMRRAKEALLVDLQTSQVITSADARVGVQGMGGIGKSVLAAALVRDREVRYAYPDGIIWVSFRQHLDETKLITLMRNVASHLGNSEQIDTIPQGQNILREIFASKAILLVLDDVWQARDAQVFDMLGPRCRMLVTTRDAGILNTLNGELVPVSLFTETEALQLLANIVNLDPGALPLEAHAIIKACGSLPLAIALCGGMAKAGTSWLEILEALNESDLEWIEDRHAINPQHISIWKAMKVSYDMLGKDEKKRFTELAVFSIDRNTPEAAVQTLWEHTGPLQKRYATSLLRELSERSLIQLESQQSETGGEAIRRFSLHDLLYDFSLKLAGDTVALHKTLAAAYRKKCSDGWHTGPDDGYFFENICHHLVNSGEMQEAVETSTDFSFLMSKAEQGLLDSITADFLMLGEMLPVETKEQIVIWEAFFREKAHILRRGNDEWPAHKILLQLAVEHADDSPITKDAEQYLQDGKVNWPWIRRMQRVEHTGVSPCIAVLEGHAHLVYDAHELEDGRILSRSGDRTLRLWDKNGKPLNVLKEHTSSISGAHELEDGRILSWSYENLRLWDKHGKPLNVLKGHKGRIDGALELVNGRLLSWSQDKTLRLWDKNGKPLNVLKGHSNMISGALELRDGRFLSWSGETLRLWDKDGRPLYELKGNTGFIGGAVELGDGRLLSWSRDGTPWSKDHTQDHTLRLWDKDGLPLHKLKGHTGEISGAHELGNGRLLSWSRDHTLRLWDKDGLPLHKLKGHTGWIGGAHELGDGRLLSWSKDHTLRLWNKDGNPLKELKGHSSEISGAHELGNGRLLSWSWDRTLRLWDKDGLSLYELKGHTGGIGGAHELGDGRLLSWSKDHTLRLWSKDVLPLKELKGHTREVLGAHELGDGRILSWSFDNTLRLWNKEGHPFNAFEGHTKGVFGAQELGDGRILSWSWDRTLRLWDRNGLPLYEIKGHTDSVDGGHELGDGRILSWSWDRTLRLWDRDGKLLYELKGHTGWISGALELEDGRILSWSKDNTLRLWDKDGNPLKELKGHTSIVVDAQVLEDGRILSWSWDKTLRLWDKDGLPINELKGHTYKMTGAHELGDGRILSWSEDKTLRLWDKDGNPRKELKGHTKEVYGAHELGDGRILSWSEDKTLRLWDKDGQLLSNHPIHEGFPPYWSTPIFMDMRHGKDVMLLNAAKYRTGQTMLRYLNLEDCDNRKSITACWNGASECRARLLKPDGRILVTQDNGQVCFLQLYYGNKKIEIEEFENISQIK